jgi:hypothetical protein
VGAEFLSLGLADQRDAYTVGAANLGRNETSLEKDVWVCWVLDALFRCPDLPAMAFKGGTSLSKAYAAISRFSEDVDITMNGSDLIPGFDPFQEAVSRKKRDQHGEELKAAVQAVSLGKVLPHLQARLVSLANPGGQVRVEDDGATLVVEYPTAVSARETYYSEGVKVEFGGRNMTEPHEQHQLSPYLAAEFPELDFVSADVHVLAGERTFWEKVTLAHAESSRPEFKASSGRSSRHWYDLAVLSQHDIGARALADLELLEDVIRVKSMYFRVGHVDYGHCLTGQARLLPDSEGRAVLREDYEAMVAAGMLEAPISFDDVEAAVLALENRINGLASSVEG